MSTLGLTIIKCIGGVVITKTKTMRDYTTLSVSRDVADEVRRVRDANDYENTTAALRELLSNGEQ